MITPEDIVIVCWIIFLLYWIASWRAVKPSQNKRKYGFVRVAYITIVIVLILNHFVFGNVLHINVCSWTPHGCHINILPALQSVPVAGGFPGVVLSVIGLIVAISARHMLGANWSSFPDLKKNHTLVTSGIYSHIRHPIYTGVLCMAIGTLLTYPIAPVAIYCLVLLIIFLRRIPKEEALMTQTFPKEYKAYKARTKALIPFVY